MQGSSAEKPNKPCAEQVALGGLTHWTVGLLATFMSVACVVAADTGAYAFGKTLGRTQLTAISPKKTVEGAFGGLLCSTALALGFWRVLAWPAHPALAVRLLSPLPPHFCMAHA